MTVAIGFNRAYVLTLFGHVTLGATVYDGVGVENDEQGAPIWICSDRRASWSELWPGLRQYG